MPDDPGYVLKPHESLDDGLVSCHIHHTVRDPHDNPCWQCHRAACGVDEGFEFWCSIGPANLFRRGEKEVRWACLFCHEVNEGLPKLDEHVCWNGESR